MNAYTLQYLLCVFAATVLHKVLQIILLGKSRAIKKKNLPVQMFATVTMQRRCRLLSLQLHLQNPVLENAAWSRFGRIWSSFAGT